MDSIAWQHAKNDYTDDLRAAGRPATTIRLRRQHITQLTRAVAAEDPWQVTPRDLLDWFALVSERRVTSQEVRADHRLIVITPPIQGWSGPLFRRQRLRPPQGTRFRPPAQPPFHADTLMTWRSNHG